MKTTISPKCALCMVCSDRLVFLVTCFILTDIIQHHQDTMKLCVSQCAFAFRGCKWLLVWMQCPITLWRVLGGPGSPCRGDYNINHHHHHHYHYHHYHHYHHHHNNNNNTRPAIQFEQSETKNCISMSKERGCSDMCSAFFLVSLS